MKDLGKLKYFLNIEIAILTQGISLCQRKYILELLSEYGMLSTKPISALIDYNSKLTKECDEGQLVDVTRYRKLIKKIVIFVLYKAKYYICFTYISTIHG